MLECVIDFGIHHAYQRLDNYEIGLSRQEKSLCPSRKGNQDVVCFDSSSRRQMCDSLVKRKKSNTKYIINMQRYAPKAPLLFKTIVLNTYFPYNNTL